jgi:hypothetical protein
MALTLERLSALAALGVWKFHFYDPLNFRYERVVVGVQGVFELVNFIARWEATPRADVRLATDILGIVGGEGGSGWAVCRLADARILRSEFVRMYGLVHEIRDYPPLEQ